MKTTEAVLRESEERFRLAAQAGRMYAYDWNAKTNEVVRSPEFVAVLGLTNPVPLSDEQFVNGIHPDDRSRFLAEIDSLTPEKPNRDITYRFQSPRGGVVWLRSSGCAFFDGDGKLQNVIGMVTDVTEQKLNEERLREYEKAVESAEEMIAVVDREYRYLIANRNYLEMRNMNREQVIGHSARQVLNRGVFEAVVKEKLDECFRGNIVRYEMKYMYPGIGERDVSISYFPIEGEGGIDRVVCIARDITDQKQAERALSGVSRKLIEAQDQERTRIARELHDDIGQRLALLAIGLDKIEQESPTLPQNVLSRFGDLKTQTLELARDVQALSRTLHNSKVETLGLAMAMRSTCREFGEHRKMEIDFKSSDMSSPVPDETSFCFMRVLQEALQNCAKHSGVKRVEVLLRGTPDEIQLNVSDSGKGFDIDAAMQGPGLGLTSMRERVRLVNGTILTRSRPMGGTIIDVRVPLRSEVKV